ncbi:MULTISPECIES: aminotransferase-like domain-containing protein [Pseudonocardia]|uniref:HTH-type transcriptional regulatory protein GabR n=2 Tax=Pseudonocardia TaxID=1847 RepID=A0A1Y2MLK3_PSEAH|nr:MULTISPECIES: PLP-dependent aminotransferase family protein [Pseudonocardia]OSY36155.1 HTH-type transcriptional regulatory protein GabR [Pseudonocardia autotrophica]TDN76588.1 GntR family transcriptional regulator/MocR family aminotransferase [Pseudonocardia autotrophica]BBG00589.1 GntR family transcriptional regulator [Pseudonocardia autotrophica]GEC26973.1 GntR family transcriptional regulator [Pseudonocardia saturnea]
MDVPPLPLDRGSPVPLAVQLADGLRGAAVGGMLRPGDRLPSTRALATALGVSRTVTAAAFDQLLAEGWVAGRVGAGTYVTALPVGLPGGADRPAAAGAERAPGPAGAGVPDALDPGRPCVAALDRAMWRRAWRAAADPEPDDAPRPDGLSGFHTAVVEHLLRHRGLAPDDVLSTAGTSAAVAELARLLPAGARVAVEEPGYRRAVSALRAAGLRIVPVPVDDDGLVVDAVPAGCAAVYVTPAHQFPTAVRMPAARRVALVERAREEGFLIIEDDYDGELRYDVAPLPLLAALAPDRVVHLGTASKIVSPTLGVGWALAPAPVLAAWRDLRDRTGTRPSPAGQRVLIAMARHGDLSRHLRRLRRELRERRALVLAAAAGAGWRAHGDPAGAHLVLRGFAGTEAALIAAAAGRGIVVRGLAEYHDGPPRTSGLVVGYAAGTRADLRRALARLTG